MTRIERYYRACIIERDAEKSAHARTRRALRIAVTSLKCIGPPGSRVAKNAEEEIAERALKAIARARRSGGGRGKG